MTRNLNIGDAKGRNSQVVFTGKTAKPLIKYLTAEGEGVKNTKLLKSTIENSFQFLMQKHGDPNAIAESIINGDPEINLQLTGRFITTAGRLYVDSNFNPVFRVKKIEKVYGPDGVLKEERVPKETFANILGELPIKHSGKIFPKKDIYNKFVFTKKYQLRHVNGLTYDFLFEMAKELHEKDALMLIGAGAKGIEPIVFQDGGKPYRAFLEGRIKDNTYLLIVHLSNLELKAIS